MSDNFQREIRFLGPVSSPAFGREPEGNGSIARSLRALREQLLRVRHFETLEALVEPLEEFRQRDTGHRRLSGVPYDPRGTRIGRCLLLSLPHDNTKDCPRIVYGTPSARARRARPSPMSPMNAAALRSSARGTPPGQTLRTGFQAFQVGQKSDAGFTVSQKQLTL
ncbi:MAG: hypothetical protein ACP5VC_05590 [Bryobacteraceae bacterium]